MESLASVGVRVAATTAMMFRPRRIADGHTVPWICATVAMTAATAAEDRPMTS